MAILPAIFGLVGRWIGRILNTAFSWATIMLFGKVPQGRQIFLSILSFGSVAWLIVLLGVIFPSVATFLLAFVTLPAWVNDNMVRLAMLAAAVLIPPIVGFVSLFVLDPEDRPQGAAAKAKTVLKGYLFTAGLAITLLMMTIAAPLMRLPIIIKRWSTQHVPMVVESNDYLSVVEEMQQALKTAGYETSRHPISWMMRFPTKILTAIAGGTIQNLVADNLTTLKAPNLEVVLHPSDLVINGKEADLVHARATVTQQLAFSRAYMSWTKEAQDIEDRLTTLWHGLQGGDRAYATGPVAKELQTVEQDLGKIKLPFEEWEVLMRKKLLVERGALQVAAGLVDRPPDLSDAKHDQLGGKQLAQAKPLPQRLLTPRYAALALIALFTWFKLKPHHEDPDRHMQLERIF